MRKKINIDLDIQLYIWAKKHAAGIFTKDHKFMSVKGYIEKLVENALRTEQEKEEKNDQPHSNRPPLI